MPEDANPPPSLPPPPAGTPPADTAPPPSPPVSAPPPARDHWGWQFAVTIGLLVAFAILVLILMVNAKDASEVEWGRRVFLLGGVEAIVFTSVGWLFGREVHRSEAATAKDSAAKATKEAAAAKDEAKAKGEEAAVERTKGRAMKAAVRATGEPASRGGDGAEETSLGGGTPTQGAPLNLRSLADELWPD